MVRDTRAVLIAAAIDTLRESGFAAASARRIAAKAGCNQALIFYHFGSVPDLLVATKPVTHWLDEWAGILNIPSQFSVIPLEPEHVEQERL